MIHMEYYLVVSTIMMFAGIYGFFTRRNTLAILISVELMLNATDINFAVFNRFLFGGLFLCTLFHRHLGCGNCNSYRHHD
jgi:NADH-quinone oxidoreductase subunit K